MKEWFIGLRRGLIIFGSGFLLEGIIGSVVMGSFMSVPSYVLITLSSLLLIMGIIGVKMNKSLPEPLA